MLTAGDSRTPIKTILVEQQCCSGKIAYFENKFWLNRWHHEIYSVWENSYYTKIIDAFTIVWKHKNCTVLKHFEEGNF